MSHKLIFLTRVRMTPLPTTSLYPIPELSQFMLKMQDKNAMLFHDTKHNAVPLCGDYYPEEELDYKTPNHFEKK